jgi:hypothetical protein
MSFAEEASAQSIPATRPTNVLLHADLRAFCIDPTATH